MVRTDKRVRAALIKALGIKAVPLIGNVKPHEWALMNKPQGEIPAGDTEIAYIKFASNVNADGQGVNLGVKYKDLQSITILGVHMTDTVFDCGNILLGAFAPDPWIGYGYEAENLTGATVTPTVTWSQLRAGGQFDMVFTDLPNVNDDVQLGGYYSGPAYTKGRCYGRITTVDKSGHAVGEYIPVIHNNEVCYWDKISKTYKVNTGSVPLEEGV